MTVRGKVGAANDFGRCIYQTYSAWCDGFLLHTKFSAVSHEQWNSQVNNEVGIN